MTTSIVRVTTPAPRDIWRQVCELDPDTLISQTPRWYDALCATGEYQDVSRLYETDDGGLMVLPLVRRRGARGLLTTEASPPPGRGIGGLISSRPLCAEDVSAVFSDLSGRAVMRTALRPNPLQGDVWAAACQPGMIAIPRNAHVLDLEGGFDTVWMQRFGGATRTKVRKGEKSGLDIECDTTGKLLPVFFALLQKSIVRWARRQNEPLWLARWRGARRDPLGKFEQLARHLGEQFQVWVAWYRGEAAAAAIVLKGKNAHYTRGAMDRGLAGPTRANYFLQRLAIEDACRSGCRYYHMGETGPSASLAEFKRSFGAEPHSYAEYRVERLPFTAVDARVRGFIKQLIGFKDA